MNVRRLVYSGLLPAVIGTLLPAMPVSAQQPTLTAAQISRIDSLFSRYSAADVPGCALAVSRHDTVVLERGWGSANLEHTVSITPATIFEAGSVSKQFTAAAALILAQQGKLSLDDDVRKYLPELPVYNAPITIRHLIHHTSGLRDWGAVMSIAGWPRGTRTYTQAHVLDIVARQKALNYPVGAEYLYSNSNYNLLAMIVERVSGKTLAEFTRAELFEPLAMKSTSWRDDHQRIVPGRAHAYSGGGKTWRLQMPFENVYGNSSLLTTVGDLLKWNANLGHERVGGAEFVAMQQMTGKARNGSGSTYAAGLHVDKFQGTTVIFHDGATAGYRAFLARYPDAGHAVALLCNAGDANPVALGEGVASIVLPPYTAPTRTPVDTIGVAVAAPRLQGLAGYYRNPMSREPLQLVVSGGQLLANGRKLVALTPGHFTSVTGRTHVVFDDGKRGARSSIRLATMDADMAYADTMEFLPIDSPRGEASYSDYIGKFFSEEADATVSVVRDGKGLALFARPNRRSPMVPIYADGFSTLEWSMEFTRGKDGKVDGFLLTSGRARNVRFDKGK